MADDGEKSLTPQPIPSEETPSPVSSITSGKSPRKLSMEDFTIVRCLGKGTFGEVILAKGKVDKKKYAIKMLSKEHMEKVGRAG